MVRLSEAFKNLLETAPEALHSELCIATADEAGVVLVRRRRDKEGPVTEVIDPGLNDESIEAATAQLSAVMNLDA